MVYMGTVFFSGFFFLILRVIQYGCLISNETFFLLLFEFCLFVCFVSVYYS